MTKQRIVVGLALFSLLSPVASYADEKTDEALWLQTSDWNLLIDEMPDRDIEAAKSSFASNEWDKAAIYIERAAAFTRVEASRAASTSKAMLQNSANKLSELGVRVKSGTINSLDELDTDFSEAQQSLAAHYHELATIAHKAGDDASAGHYLDKAADSLQAAVSWSGIKAAEATDLVVQEAKHAGAALKSGMDWSMSKAEQWSLKLHDEIVEFGKQL